MSSIFIVTTKNLRRCIYEKAVILKRTIQNTQQASLSLYEVIPEVKVKNIVACLAYVINQWQDIKEIIQKEYKQSFLWRVIVAA